MLKAVNPATGETVREVETDTATGVENKLISSQKAFREWRAKSYSERADLLNAVAKYMRDNVETLGPFMTEEMGKPKKESVGEVNKSAWCAEHYAEHAESYLEREVIESDASRSYVQHLPLGTILGILPWNAPFWLAFRFAAPSLMAGNTCLMKHDPHVPGCAEAIEKCFREVGAPDGLFQALYLKTPDVEGVIRDKRVRGVSFTGSSRGGAKVAAAAGGAIKPAVLELGGSDPSIVLADADLEKAADTLTLSRIINAGQSCIAAKRIIVEGSVYDEMTELMKDRMSKLKVGDPTKDDTDVGPIARPDLRDELNRQVQETKKQGAKCLLGGEMPEGEGYFYPVTLLADVKPGMAAFSEETFGPVGVMIRASDEAHALKMANDTDYGLAASIWTNAARGEKLASQLDTGQVSVNGIVKTDPRLPSGGTKSSGVGRELGPHGIREFVNAQQVWIGPAKG